MGSGRGWLACDLPSTGGVLNTTAAAWTAGFHWWRSGNITQTQNVSEYMLVHALRLMHKSAVVLQLFSSSRRSFSTLSDGLSEYKPKTESRGRFLSPKRISSSFCEEVLLSEGVLLFKQAYGRHLIRYICAWRPSR